MGWIFQYRLAGNANDSGPHGLNLATSGGSWTGSAGNQGFHIADVEVGDRISGTLNSAVASALSGLQKFSFVAKINRTDMHWQGGPMLHIEGAVLITDGSNAGATVGFELNDSGALAWLDTNYRYYVLVFDSTQSTASNRLKIYYLDHTNGNSFESYDVGDNDIAQNSALPTLSTSTNISIANRYDNVSSNEGTTRFIGMLDEAINAETAEAILLNLVADDDADPMAAPAFGWVSAPAADQINSSSARIRFTVNEAATSIKVLNTAAGSSQPDPSAFAGETSLGTVDGFSVFTYNATGLAASTARRFWFQVYNGTDYIYNYVGLTTTAVSNAIQSINGNNAIPEGTTGIVGIRETGATGTTSTAMGGVTQGNHTVVSDTEWTFDWVWPNTLYGQNATVNVSGVTRSAGPIVPAVGSSYVTLASGYNPATPGTVILADTGGGSDALVAGDQIGWENQGNAVSVDNLGRIQATNGFNGSLVAWVVDSTTGLRSANATIPFAVPGDIIPDQFTLGANAMNQEPGTVVVRSFVVAGVDANTDVTFTATGNAQVSTTDSGGWGSSVVRQLGQAVYVRITGSSTFGQTRTGGVSSSGVSAYFIVGARAAIEPAITAQPENHAPVTVGTPATFSISGTNIASRQWRVNGNSVAGATGATFVYTPAAVGTYSVSCVLQSSEGASTTSATVTVVAIAAAGRVRVPALRDRASGQLRGGENNVPCYVLSDDRSTRIIASTTINLSASGTTDLVSNQLGAIGSWVRVGFPSASGNTAAEVRLQVEA